MRRFILACGLVLAFAGLTTAAAAAVGSKRATAGGTNPATTTTTTTTQASMTATARRPGKRAITYWTRHIRASRAGTQRWLAVINGRPARSGSARRLSARSFARLPGLARLWRHREHAAWWRANHPPELRGWTCIHRYEGSWRDSGGPYYGGLQMDLSFQATYGSWLLRHRGTADHWSPLEQIWTAVRAWRVRGFSPWLSTAHYCGMT